MREIAFHVFTTTSLDRDDGSPVQMVSTEMLTRYREAEVIAVAACALALGVGLAGLIMACRALA